MKNDNELAISGMLSPKPNESSVDYVINSIKELLLTKKIVPGDRLPAEMELAKLLSVSRGSIREAMKILSAFGIVEIKRGDGTYVSSDIEGKVLFDPLLFSFILSAPEFDELKELRVLLEKDVIRLAIKNAGEEDIKLLRQCYESMETLKHSEDKNYDELLACDMEFHYILGKLTKNRLLEKIYRFVMEYFQPYTLQSIRNHTYFSLESNETHKRLLTAVEERDAASGEYAVENSIQVWEELIFKCRPEA
ncbi:FadR/GntR family transcriptional regulator [Propionispora sp. 2/2-37]|uniref:FadR/GntR family transcriptional regulator n=1 Tax=Propionispora sp. 2/2-37 TaxID=1677858 RepID=UPI001F167D6D|nr:FadR/GntR family transcriptional regulator [Propionispora sp. 2/2-37]